MEVEKKRVAKAAVEVEGSVLTFTFSNGNIRTFDVSRCSDEIRHRLMLHGAEQKLRDCYAGAGSPDEAEGLWQKVSDQLLAGQFNSKREGGPAAEGTIEQLARAMVMAWAEKGQTKNYEDVLAYVKGLSKEQRSALRARPAVAVALAKIKTEGKSVAPTGDDMIDGL
jgi:hypothetical protein